MRMAAQHQLQAPLHLGRLMVVLNGHQQQRVPSLEQSRNLSSLSHVAFC